jgi:glycosyltransferase involved in cell wall biosynthesis
VFFRPCAVVVTDRELLPITTGNRLRILGVLAALRALGWKVVLVGVAGAAPPDALRALVDGFVAVDAPPFPGGDITRFDARAFRRVVERVVRQERALVVIAEYVWLAPVLERLPRLVRRVLDCHDVFHERTVRFKAAGLDPWARCSQEQELRRLSISDVILATQEREAGLLRDMLPRRVVACILTPIELPRDFRRTASEGHVVVTVGANHPGNEAVLAFARDEWPRVIDRVPDARLKVVGEIASLLPDLPRVERIGRVHDVSDYYAEAAVVVCPVTVGTGVKTKMLESLRFGKATVVTTAAAEGMPAAARRSWVTAQTLAGCAIATAELLENPTERAELESAAFEFGARHVSHEAFRTQLRAVLPGALSRGLALLRR